MCCLVENIRRDAELNDKMFDVCYSDEVFQQMIDLSDEAKSRGWS